MSGSAVLAAATLGASASNYLLNLLLARWMTPAEFGDANLVVTVMLGLTAVAVTLQLVSARRTSTGDTVAIASARSGLLRRAWIIGTGVAAVTIVASPVLRDVTSSASAVPFVLLAVGIPSYLAQAVERGGLQGRLRFGALAATLIVEATVRLAVGLALVVAGFGVAGATAGITASFLATWLVARRSVGHASTGADSSSPTHSVTGPLADTGDAHVDRHATQAAAILLVGQIIVNNGDVVLAKTLFDADDAGVYSVVALIGRAIFFLSWSIVTAAFPHAARASDVEARIVERRAVRTVAAVSATLTVAIAVAAPTLTPLVFGRGYAAAGSLFLPYAIATSLFAVSNVRATLAAARGQRRPACIVVVGGIAQGALLLARADAPGPMAWLQVCAMAALVLVLAAEHRSRSSRPVPAQVLPLRQDCRS